MLHHSSRPMSTEMKRCIDACIECHNICTSTVNHCLSMGGLHAEASHITMLLDCAETCQISANFMLRASPLHVRTCMLCAEICIRCAEDCKRLANDAHMEACAAACRSCAESCHAMTAIA